MASCSASNSPGARESATFATITSSEARARVAFGVSSNNHAHATNPVRDPPVRLHGCLRAAVRVLSRRHVRSEHSHAGIRARIRDRQLPHRVSGARAVARGAEEVRSRANPPLWHVGGEAAAVPDRHHVAGQPLPPRRDQERDGAAARSARDERRRRGTDRGVDAGRRLDESCKRRQRVGRVRVGDPDQLPAGRRDRSGHERDPSAARDDREPCPQSGEPRTLRHLVQQRPGDAGGNGGSPGGRAPRALGHEHQQQPLPDRSQSRCVLPVADRDEAAGQGVRRVEPGGVRRSSRPDEEHVLPSSGRRDQPERHPQSARLDEPVRKRDRRGVRSSGLELLPPGTLRSVFRGLLGFVADAERVDRHDVRNRRRRQQGTRVGT